MAKCRLRRGGIEGRHSDWQAATERALLHYHRAGWSAAGCLAELTAALLHGPTPVAEGVQRCDQLLEEATDKAGRANILFFKGGLEALDGRLDEGRRRVAKASSTYKEIGEIYSLANNSGRILGRLELIAGDFRAAELALRESCNTLERFNDWAGLSTSAADLAQALYGQDRVDEAEGVARGCAGPSAKRRSQRSVLVAGNRSEVGSPGREHGSGNEARLRGSGGSSSGPTH